jgi:hypothetical protein
MDQVSEQASVSDNTQEPSTAEMNEPSRESGEMNVQSSESTNAAELAAETSSTAPSRSTDRLPTTDWLDGDPEPTLTSAMISRYFKLTAVMLGLNAVLASVSVIALFRRPSEPRTIVVAAPPAPAQPIVLPPPPPSPQAVAPPEAARTEKPATNPLRALPGTPSPTVEKIPLLGVPSTKRTLLAPGTAPKRLAATPVKSAPSASENSDDEGPAVHLAERW